MRTIVRILAILLLGILAVLVLGQNAPQGSFLRDAADAIVSALKLQWFPSIAT